MASGESLISKTWLTVDHLLEIRLISKASNWVMLKGHNKTTSNNIKQSFPSVSSVWSTQSLEFAMVIHFVLFVGYLVHKVFYPGGLTKKQPPFRHPPPPTLRRGGINVVYFNGMGICSGRFYGYSTNPPYSNVPPPRNSRPYDQGLWKPIGFP